MDRRPVTHLHLVPNDGSEPGLGLDNRLVTSDGYYLADFTPLPYVHPRGRRKLRESGLTSMTHRDRLKEILPPEALAELDAKLADIARRNAEELGLWLAEKSGLPLKVGPEPELPEE